MRACSTATPLDTPSACSQPSPPPRSSPAAPMTRAFCRRTKAIRSAPAGATRRPADGVLELPRPTGPHPVGTQIRALTDGARGEEGDGGSLSTAASSWCELFYPADPCGIGQLAPYLSPEEGDSRRTTGGLPIEDGFEASIVTHARAWACRSPKTGRPTRCSSSRDGFGMLRADYTSLPRGLWRATASWWPPSATPTTPSSVFPDGRAVPFGSVVLTPAMDASEEEIEAFSQAMNEHVAVWVDDALRARRAHGRRAGRPGRPAHGSARPRAGRRARRPLLRRRDGRRGVRPRRPLRRRPRHRRQPLRA